MTTTTPLPLPRASRPRVAPPDDRLKDADTMGFVRAFEPDERQRWLDWAAAFRAPDALAESDPRAFEAFRSSWRHAQAMGFATTAAPAEAWGDYLDALADYHVSGLVIRTLAEHDEMLLRLSGPPMRFAPGMPEELWDAAAHFGALDQFYNNLRDMQEDAERGMCWLPEEVLQGYGITREDVIGGRAPEMAGWHPMMRWWTMDHRAQLERAAIPLIDAPSPSPAIDLMLSWTIRRYERTRFKLRAVDYDYRRFGDVYWPEVRIELDRVSAE